MIERLGFTLHLDTGSIDYLSSNPIVYQGSQSSYYFDFDFKKGNNRVKLDDYTFITITFRRSDGNVSSPLLLERETEEGANYSIFSKLLNSGWYFDKAGNLAFSLKVCKRVQTGVDTNDEPVYTTQILTTANGYVNVVASASFDSSAPIPPSAYDDVLQNIQENADDIDALDNRLDDAEDNITSLDGRLDNIEEKNPIIEISGTATKQKITLKEKHLDNQEVSRDIPLPSGLVTMDDIPTKVSELENDEGYLNEVTEQDVVDALGYTPLNPENLGTASEKDYTSSVDDSNNLPTSSAVKQFVNSSIATNTANFLGTFNIVTDLGLTTSATEQQIASALTTALTGTTVTNNDYVFVSYPDAVVSTEYVKFDRWKASVENNIATWNYEYTLNNSSFTAQQWASINSGITSTLVSQIGTNAQDIASLQAIKYGATLYANGTTLQLKDQDGNVLSTVALQDTTNYEEFTNVPIVYLNGTQSNPTILYNLNAGIYRIRGYYSLSESDSAVNLISDGTGTITPATNVNIIMFVSTTSYNTKYLTFIGAFVSNTAQGTTIYPNTAGQNIVSSCSVSINSTSFGNIHNIDLNRSVTAYNGISETTDGVGEVLTTNNTETYTPTGDYNPAPKKYVDDTVATALANAGLTKLNATTNINLATLSTGVYEVNGSGRLYTSLDYGRYNTIRNGILQVDATNKYFYYYGEKNTNDTWAGAFIHGYYDNNATGAFNPVIDIFQWGSSGFQSGVVTKKFNVMTSSDGEYYLAGFKNTSSAGTSDAQVMKACESLKMDSNGNLKKGNKYFVIQDSSTAIADKIFKSSGTGTGYWADDNYRKNVATEIAQFFTDNPSFKYNGQPMYLQDISGELLSDANVQQYLQALLTKFSSFSSNQISLVPYTSTRWAVLQHTNMSAYTLWYLLPDQGAVYRLGPNSSSQLVEEFDGFTLVSKEAQTIVVCTQQEYDALVAPDAKTIYMIKES